MVVGAPLGGVRHGGSVPTPDVSIDNNVASVYSRGVPRFPVADLPDLTDMTGTRFPLDAPAAPAS
ncbi:hypothetical protein GCM10022227_33860 [Streptomyces sedi]